MSVENITRVRMREPWRQSSTRPVPTKLPLYPADLGDEDRRETKIWDAFEFWPANIDTRAKESTVGCWLVYAPWMHMVWAWHYVGLVHLRPVDGLPPATRSFPGATHEFIVFALDPNVDVIVEALRFLQPVSIVQQFDAASDAHARLIVEDSLELVAKGKCSVDSDFRPVWRHLLTECADRPIAP